MYFICLNGTSKLQKMGYKAPIDKVFVFLPFTFHFQTKNINKQPRHKFFIFIIIILQSS
jgi:hypothetical protein